VISFSVCPHDTQKGLKRWSEFTKKLEHLLGEGVNFEVLGGHEEEYIRIERGDFFDVYYAGPLVSPRLYQMGYLPVAKFRGQRDRLFLVVKDRLPEEGPILVAIPFLKPAGYPIMGLDVERVKLVFTKNFPEVFQLLKEGHVHAGVMYNETWNEIDEEEKQGFYIIEDHIFDTSHIFMVRSGLYERLRSALLSFKELEPSNEEDIRKTIKLYMDFDRFLKLWSGVSLAQALEKATHIGFFVYGEQVLFANKTFLKMVDYTSEELKGMDVYQAVDMLIHPDYRGFVKKVVKRRLSGEELNIDYGELPLLRRDGTLVWTIVSSSTILYEGSYAGVVFFVDITKRKRLERLYGLLKEVNQIITQVLLEEELLERVCHSLVGKMGIRFVWIGASDKKEHFKPVTYCGDGEKYLESVASFIEEEPTYRAYVANRIIVNPDTTELDVAEALKREMLSRSYLSSCAVPLSKEGETVYVLGMYAEEPYYFQEETKDVLYELRHDLEFALNRLEDLQRNKLIASALENSTSWVVITERDGTITYVNDAVCQISGYSRQDLIGQNPRIFKSGHHTQDFYRSLWETILSGQEFHATFANRRKDGELFYLEQTIYPIELPNRTVKFMSVGRDITREVHLSSEVEKLTFYDPATGILNLDGIRFKAGELINKKKMCALFLVDLYGMSLINKNYGIQVGDMVLSLIAKRLQDELGESGVVGRVASDEFALFMPIVKEEESIILADRIEEVIGEPIYFEGERLKLSVNMGIALYPMDGSSFNQLHEKASIALSSAKKAGEGERRFFESAFEERVKEAALAIGLVSRAVEEDLFIFYYQPYFRGEDIGLAGFEALVRIRDKDGKIYGPAHFVEYLESSKYLRSFEGFALREALRFFEKFKLPVSINISARSFKDRGFIEVIAEQLKGSSVIVEITERVFIDEREKAIEHITILKESGVKIALDDFGTGYSSLGYISNLPVDEIKIDISFVREIVKDPRKRAVVGNLIKLASDLGIETLAEGVETQEQLKILRDMGCTYVQGYLLGKPMPEEEALKLISMV
jgi:diguanylate cyclase (GGDEF)-like protein/PAS domain S-box-containing protein